MVTKAKAKAPKEPSVRVPLTIDVAGSWEIEPGGAQGPDRLRSLYVTARIEDQLGNALSGLKQANFRVFQTGFSFKPVSFAPATQFTIPFQELQGGVLPGTYTLHLTPRVNAIGQFSFVLVVSAQINVGKLPGRAIGQALFTVVKLR